MKIICPWLKTKMKALTPEQRAEVEESAKKIVAHNQALQRKRAKKRGRKS